MCISDDGATLLSAAAVQGAAELNASLWKPLDWYGIVSFFNNTVPYDDTHTTFVQIQWSSPNGTATTLESATLELCTGYGLAAADRPELRGH